MDNEILNKAEKIVYENIKNYFSKRNAIQLFQYPIFNNSGNTRYEADNIIIDYELGMINIEVKGLKIENIDYIEGNTWYCKNFYKEKIMPYKQAELQIDSLYKKLKEKNILKGDTTKRIFIALPLIESSEWNSSEFNRMFTPTILFKDDFQNGSWIEKLKHGILCSKNPHISLDDFKSIEESLFKFKESKNIGEKKQRESIFSKLWILNRKSDITKIRKIILEDASEGIKTYIISSSDIIEQISLKGNIYVDNDIINLYIHNTQNLNEELIINGKNINQSLSNCLENILNFNFKQYKAIHCNFDENVSIEASAGTGKTYLLVDRLMYLLISSNVKMEDVSMITFTNSATDELKSRISNRLKVLFKVTGKMKFLDLLENVNSLQISTIHSFAKKIILQHADILGLKNNIKVTSMKNEKRELVESLIDSFIKETDKNNIKKMLEYNYYEIVNFIIEIIEKIENKSIAYDSIDDIDYGTEKSIMSYIVSYVIPKIDSQLREKKIRENKLEVSDLIRSLSNIKKLKEKDFKLRFLFVDEFQDSDIGQIQFFSKLINDMNYRVFVIGDTKQSIYRFRGANETAYEQLKLSSNKEIKSLSLINNYRSSKTLIDKYNEIFKSFNEMKLIDYRNDDLVIGQKEFKSEIPVLNIIKLEKSNQQELKNKTIKLVQEIKEKSNKNTKIGIFVRSNDDVIKVKNWFENTNFIVKQNVTGDFFKSEAVMDFRTLLLGLLFHTDSCSLYDTYTSPYFAYSFNSLKLYKFNGDSKKITEYLNECTNNEIQFYKNLLIKEPILTVVNRIIKDKNLYDNLYTRMKDNLPDEEDSLIKRQVINYANNLNHLFNLIIKNFDTEINALPQLIEWLDIKIKIDKKENALEPNIEDYNIEIMTVHKSKGLEFDYVILPKMTQSFASRNKDIIFNSQKMELSWSLNKNNSSENYQEMKKIEANEIEKEEARLLYVAITRAIRSVSIILPNSETQNTWAKLVEKSLRRMNR